MTYFIDRFLFRDSEATIFVNSFFFKEKSYFIGDKESDRLAAKNFKLKYINVDNETNLYNLVKRKIK